MIIYNALKQIALRALPERLLLPLKKLHYARMLDGNAASEPEFQVLAHLVHQGDTVLDIGANVGTYTKLLSTLVGVGGTVYSVEPVPSTYEILQFNIGRHQLENVKPIAAAVSDHEHMVEMAVPRYPTGGENFYMASVVGDMTERSQRRFNIRSTTVDAVCSGPVHFIKCDVEGHEDAVIRGATRTIQNYHPAWLVEVSKREVLRIMEDIGYQTFWFDGNVLRRQTATDCVLNSFFFTDAQLERLHKNGIAAV